MYFESYGVEQAHWEHWRLWAEDITRKNAFLGLDFVREFATVYKKQSEELESEYQNTRNRLSDENNSSVERIMQDHHTRSAAIENEKNTVIATLDSENRSIADLMSQIAELENNNKAAVSISDYVQLKAQRDADLLEFNRLQEERKKIAIALFEEKKKVENEKHENALAERNRQYKERISELDSDHKTALERIEREYRKLFADTLMSTDIYEAYTERCYGFRYPLENYICRKTTPEYVYIGSLKMYIPKEIKTPLVKELIEEIFGVQNCGVDDPYEIKLPYCQKVLDGVGLFIKDVNEAGLNVAFRQENRKGTFEDELSMLLLKTFMSFPAGKVEAFTIDTGRMGAIFHEMIVLGSTQKRIIEPARSEAEAIETALSTLRSKMDGIANNYGDEFEARMKREPYYALAISNFPEGFTGKALRDLSKIVKNAAACGVAVYILATKKRLNNLSGEDEIIVNEIMQTLQNAVGNEGTLKCADKSIDGDVTLEIEGMYDYEKEQVETVIRTLLEGITNYKAISVAFDDIYPNINDDNTWMNRETTNGINIPVGIKGSSDIVNICIGAPGANKEHHVLIEGSTGAGKSTFLHTMIMSMLISYAPSELEMLLVDFKSGIEFKRYADYDIPSMKIIAVQSEREFGLQVFRELEKRFEERSEAFKRTGTASTEQYRALTNEPMPKIILVMDEYQELFIGNDDITKECERILNSLVLQGRACGIHIILATQNIRQANLNPEIYSQMAVRIALKGSANILAANNNGTEILVNSSDGTTIYNTDCGKLSANKVFQTAFLGTGDYQLELLEKISALQKSYIATCRCGSGIPGKVLYTNIEDNRRHRINRFINDGEVPEAISREDDRVYGLYLGETYKLDDSLSIGLHNKPNSNLLVSVSREHLPKIMTNVLVSLLYADLACKNATKENRLIHFVNMKGERLGKHMRKLESLFPEYIKYASPHTSAYDWAIDTSDYEGVKEIIDNTYNELCKRRAGDVNIDDRIIFVLAGMDKIDVLESVNAYEKQHVDEYAFDSAEGSREKKVLDKLLEIIKDGPENGINTVMTTNDIEVTESIFGEIFYDSFALRIGQQLSEDHMKKILHEHHSENLKSSTIVFYMKNSSENKKFRAYEIPGDNWLRSYADRYRSFCGGNE